MDLEIKKDHLIKEIYFKNLPKSDVNLNVSQYNRSRNSGKIRDWTGGWMKSSKERTLREGVGGPRSGVTRRGSGDFFGTVIEKSRN